MFKLMMKRLCLLFLLCQCACQGSYARVAQQVTTVKILSEHGTQLPTFIHQGKYYVMGNYGDAYKIRVHNRTSKRVEAVVTVDGQDVINGKVGSYKHRGYVIDAGDYVDIKGFRKSMSRVATFRFTGIGDSYAARRGSQHNVGVIGVAIFKEKSRHRPVAIAKQNNLPQWDESRRYPSKSSAGAPRHEVDTTYSASPAVRSRAKKRQIGTRYGEGRYDQAKRTTFTRAQSTPYQVIRIDYDNESGLRHRGIMIDQYMPEDPNPFPDNGEFAPSPY